MEMHYKVGIIGATASMIPAYASIFPMERTPCPPKPDMIISSFIAFSP